MTKREQEILSLLEKKPMITQNELAEKLGVTRSSAGVHLSNLMKKGYVKGKGYILNQKPYICVLGGANIDIVGFPHQGLVQQDTNAGRLQMSLGGVGRNIADNLVRLGIDTKLISVIGDDVHGKKIVDSCTDLNIDINDSLFLKNTPSSVLLVIMNSNNDIALGVSAMDIYEKLNSDFLRKKKKQIENSRLTVIDTNISEVSIDYVVNQFKSTYFLDTVSGSKVHRAKSILNKIQYLKSSIKEASILWGKKISNEADLIKAGSYFMKRGVEKVFITMGENGVFYCDRKSHGVFPAKKVKVVNTNGAGGAFCSGAIHGIYNKLSTAECVEIGMKCAEMTIQHPLSVCPSINEMIVKKVLKL